jgi:molecular chaperone HscB
MTFPVPSSPPPVSCWSCKGPVSPRALFCSTCGAVQPPGGTDHFSRLGLTPRYALEAVELERQYFGFQRRLHPDRFVTRSPRERALSQQQATALNEAYETLKDPLRRAAYLLRLAGRTVDINGSATVDDPVLLLEAMEMREALEEASGIEEITRLTTAAEAAVTGCQAELAAAFAEENLERAGTLTTRLKYLDKLAEEARSRRIRMTRQVP